jgi:membrane protease YdiL (CAAX protease family)
MTGPKKEILIKHIVAFYAFLLIVWGFYRMLLFQLPEPIEVLVIKPIIWLGPTFYLLKKEKSGVSSLGFKTDTLFTSVYFMISLGVIFTLEGFLVNYLKYGNLNFYTNIGDGFFLTSLILSLATAISEELAFRGYIFTRLLAVTNKQWPTNILTSIGWTFLHVPIAVLDWKLGMSQVSVYILLLFLFSVGSTFVYVRTSNILSPILLHVLWQWPIILFR